MLAFVGLLACASLTQAFSSVLTSNTNVLRYRVQTSLTDGGTVKPTPTTMTPVTFDDSSLILYSQLGSNGQLVQVGAANSLSAYRTLDARDTTTGSPATVNFYLLHNTAPVAVANSLCTVLSVPVTQLSRRTITVGESVSTTQQSGSCTPTTGLIQQCTVSQTTVGAKTITCGQSNDFAETAASDACPTSLTISQRRLDSLCAPLRLRTANDGTSSTYLNTLFRSTADIITLSRSGDYDLVAPINGNENTLTSFAGFENALNYEVTVTGDNSAATATTEAFYVGFVKILNAAHREFTTTNGQLSAIGSGSVSVAIETSTGALVEFIPALAAGVASPSAADAFLELPGTENGAAIQYVAKFYDGRLSRGNVYGTVAVTVTNPPTPTTFTSVQFTVVGGSPAFAPLYQVVVIQNTSPNGAAVSGTVVSLDTSAVDENSTEHIINNQIVSTPNVPGSSSLQLVSSSAQSCDFLTTSAIATNGEFPYEFGTSSTSQRTVQVVDSTSACNGALNNVFSSFPLDGDSSTTTACQRTYYFALGRTYQLTTTTTNQTPATCSGTLTGTCTTTRTLFGDLNFVGTTLTNPTNQPAGPTVVRVVVPLCSCNAAPVVCDLVNDCDVNAVLDAISDSNLLTSSIATIVSSINGNVDAVKSKVDSTKDAVDSTKDAVYLVRNNLKKFDNDVQDDVDNLKDDVKDLQNDVEDVDDKLTNVRDDVTHIRADAKAIRAKQN